MKNNSLEDYYYKKFQDGMDKRSDIALELRKSNTLYNVVSANVLNIANYLMRDSEFQEYNELQADKSLNEDYISSWIDSLAIAIKTHDWMMVADIIRGRYDHIDNLDYCGKNDMH